MAAIDPELVRRLRSLDAPGRADDHPDPARRWLALARWYQAEFAVERAWEYLAPMVDLAAWVADQPFAPLIFPSTSLAHLVVCLRPGYPRDGPSFTCGVEHHDRLFRCSMTAAGGRRLVEHVVPPDRACDLFAALVNRLPMLDR